MRMLILDEKSSTMRSLTSVSFRKAFLCPHDIGSSLFHSGTRGTYPKISGLNGQSSSLERLSGVELLLISKPMVFGFNKLF